MINRDKKIVKIVSYASGKDEYGRPRKNGSTSREVEMFVTLYQQTNTQDIRYVEVTNLGLTKDNEINDTNQIIIDDQKYQVLYVIPSKRYNQILMKKV